MNDKKDLAQSKIDNLSILFCMSAIICFAFMITQVWINVKGHNEQISINHKNAVFVDDEIRFTSDHTIKNNVIGNCSYFNNLSLNGQQLYSGWNKEVIELSSADKVIKRINLEGKTFSGCFTNHFHDITYQKTCISNLANSFVSEICSILSRQSDSNVPRVYAYCIPKHFEYKINEILVLTDRGQKLDMMKLGQTKFIDRVNLFQRILILLYKLAPLKLNDFKQDQFIIIKNQPKLVDWDDIEEADSMEAWNLDMGCKFFDAFLKYNLLYGNENHMIGTKNYMTIIRRVEEMKNTCKNGKLPIENIQDLLQMIREMVRYLPK